MNYIYVSIYLVMCSIIFVSIFMPQEAFNVLFEKKINDIIDYNHPDYTGGFTYEFNPFKKIH